MRFAGNVPDARMLVLAAGAVAVEAAALCAVIVLNAIDSASGRAWTASNAIAFIVLEAVLAVGMALVAVGIYRVRPWSRTPAVMIQLFAGIVGIWLIQAGRIGWGIPALLLAVAGLAGLFAPASLRALTHQVSRQLEGPAPPSVVDGEPFPQLRERPGEQPGHVHLGDAELGGDLRLSHVAEEAQQQDLLLPRRQPLEQRLQ